MELSQGGIPERFNTFPQYFRENVFRSFAHRGILPERPADRALRCYKLFWLNAKENVNNKKIVAVLQIMLWN
jgi:hypothetical protein